MSLPSVNQGQKQADEESERAKCEEKKMNQEEEEEKKHIEEEKLKKAKETEEKQQNGEKESTNLEGLTAMEIYAFKSCLAHYRLFHSVLREANSGYYVSDSSDSD